MSNPTHASIWPIPCPEPDCPAQIGEPCPNVQYTHMSRVRAIHDRIRRRGEAAANYYLGSPSKSV